MAPGEDEPGGASGEGEEVAADIAVAGGCGVGGEEVAEGGEVGLTLGGGVDGEGDFGCGGGGDLEVGDGEGVAFPGPGGEDGVEGEDLGEGGAEAGGFGHFGEHEDALASVHALAPAVHEAIEGVDEGVGAGGV